MRWGSNISNKIKGNAGEPMSQPPYGYIKDPSDPKHWIVDGEAAQVVRRVYSMTLEGFGTEQIAAQLEKDGVLTPRAYWLTKGIKRPGKGKQQPPTKWNSSTITKILSLQEYCGDILNFKTYSLLLHHSSICCAEAPRYALPNKALHFGQRIIPSSTKAV